MRTVMLLAMGIFIILSQSASARLRYVSQSGGSDSNGGSEHEPWATIEYAASQASAGDTILVKPGNYNERVCVTNSGTESSPIVLMSYGSERAVVKEIVVDAGYITIQGFEVTSSNIHGINVEHDAHHCMIIDNFVHGQDETGIWLCYSPPYPEHITVVGNVITNTLLDGMNLTGTNILAEENEIYDVPDFIRAFGDSIVVRNNYLHDAKALGGNHPDVIQTWRNENGPNLTNFVFEGNMVREIRGGHAHIIMASHQHSDWIIRNNVFISIGSYGMMFSYGNEGGVQNVALYNNTFANICCDDGGDDCLVLNSKTSLTAVNNIFYKCGKFVSVASSATLRAGYNLFYNTSGATGKSSVSGDPRFVNLSQYDVHLTEGSPAIDAGDNGEMVPVRNCDLDGAGMHGRVDIGAFEFGGSVGVRPGPATMKHLVRVRAPYRVLQVSGAVTHGQFNLRGQIVHAIFRDAFSHGAVRSCLAPGVYLVKPR